MKQMIHNDVRTLRAQIVLIPLMGVAICGFLWALLLHPLREEIHACRTEIMNVEGELAAIQVGIEDGDLAKRLTDASARNRQLGAEWKYLRERVDTFGDHKALREVLPTYDDGRIDFKVALFEERERLLKEAAKAQVELPEDLGVSETIGTQERAELRLWHLVATVRLVSLAIDAKLPVVSEIQSGTPRVLAMDNETGQVAMEFPIRMVFRCSFVHLVRFLDMLSQKGSFYSIRKIRVERLGTHGDRMLRAEIVAGAFLFQVRNDEPPAVSGEEVKTPGAAEDVSQPMRGRRVRVTPQRGEVRLDG